MVFCFVQFFLQSNPLRNQISIYAEALYPLSPTSHRALNVSVRGFWHPALPRARRLASSPMRLLMTG
jgi:hypothetical protein